MIGFDEYDFGVMNMTIATVGNRYQVVIPLKERKKLSLRPNSKVEVTVEDDILVIYPIERFGCLIADGEYVLSFPKRSTGRPVPEMATEC